MLNSIQVEPAEVFDLAVEKGYQGTLRYDSINHWLRRNHKLHVQVSPRRAQLTGDWYVYVAYPEGNFEVTGDAHFIGNYREAYGRGLKFALKMIDNEQT